MVGKNNATAYTYTIANNATIAYDIGTAISFFNANATNNLTISIAASDTMYLAGTTTTGSRTLRPWGFATAVKVQTTIWLISGNGLV